jgi:hypothetical protein
VVWYHKIEARLTTTALRSQDGCQCLGGQLKGVERESASGNSVPASWRIGLELLLDGPDESKRRGERI